MRFRIPVLGMSFVIMILSACATPSKNGSEQNSSNQQASRNSGHLSQQQIPVSSECGELGKSYRQIQLSFKNQAGKVDNLKVGATGYGAPPKNYYPEGQRRLMTIRASKIDAYRALAEIVGGLHIWGGTAISDMVVERDRYRLFVDTYVRGARVVSVDEMADNTYKTVVELNIGNHFLWQVLAYIDPATDKYCYEQAQNGSHTYYGYGSVAPSFYYSE